MWHSRAGAGTLVARNGHVLLVYRERSGQIRWELPSGLLEAGETFEAAAARETFEETSIRVDIGPLLCTANMNEPAARYRAINAYFHADAADDQTPSATTREPIILASFVEVATLTSAHVHPVDWAILQHWQRHPDGPPFALHLTL